MPTVYIAGPMRGYPRFNFDAFDKAEALGRSLGWRVISPAKMDRDNGIDENTLPFLPRNGGDPAFIRQFVRRDALALVNGLLAENGDAIALLPDWETSVGAVGEVGLALWLKLRVLDAQTFYPMEAELKGLSFRPPLGNCKDGLCDVNQFIAETADRIANSDHLPE